MKTGKIQAGVGLSRPLLLCLAIVCVVLRIGVAMSLPAGAAAAPTSVTATSAGIGITGRSPATLDFPLERTGESSYDTWVEYETENGSALAGRDYAGASGEVDMPAGEARGSIPVQALGASSYSPDKQLGLKLRGAAGVGPTPSFGPRESFPVGIGSKAITTADLNGDGRPDLIGSGNGGITVWLNTTPPGASSAGFAEPVSFTADTKSRGPIAVADLNGDGRPDIIVGNGSAAEGGTVSVLLNTTPPGSSSVSFAPPQTFAVGEGDPGSIAVADLNGDGRLDLVVADGGLFESNVSVLLNTTPPGSSTVSFAPPQTFLEGENPNTVAVADVNGDGRPDLVATLFNGSDAVSVLLDTTPPGSSTVSFAPPHNFPTSHNPWSVVAGDLNGDGRPDLVIGNTENEAGVEGTVSVLLNTTEPGASTPSFAPQQTFAVGRAPRFVEAADLNGDGRPDLVAFSEFNTVSALLNTTPPGSSTVSFAAERRFDAELTRFQPAIADINGDGRSDLILAGSAAVMLNTTPAPTAATPSFAAQRASPVGEKPWSVTTANLNGDGRPDVVTADHGANAVSVLLNATEPGASTPSLDASQDFPAGAKPDSVATADLNGDGRPDLVAADEGAGKVSVMLNETPTGESSAAFAAPVGFAVGGTNPSSVTTADVNGDGRPDLIVANSGADTVSVLLDTTAPGATTPSFAPQQEFATGDLMPESVTTADINGDGKPDLIVADGEDGTVSVLMNTTAPGSTTTSFAAPVSFAAGDLPLSVTTADLNGDGRPDVIVADEGEDTVSVLLDTTIPGASTPSFAPRQTFAVGDAPWSVTAADVSGDGRPDLIAADEGGSTVSVLLDTTAPGATTPSFAAQQTFVVGSGPVSVTTADLNGDGGPDIVTADSAAGTVSVLLDTQYAASITPASVIGTIHYAIPKAAVGPALLAFGARPDGTGTSEAVTLADEGGEGLAIEGIAIAGAGAAQFAEVSSCPPVLAVGSSCQISVTYTPSTAGPAAATLTVRSDDPAGPETVALSGTGSAPPPPASSHTLTVKVTGGGAGSVSDGAGTISCPSTCSHAYADGTQVSLTATAAPGSRFAGWSGGACSGTGSCRLAIGADETVAADFEKEAVKPGATVPARLKILRVRAKTRASRPLIVVTGTIAKAARGTVRVRIGSPSGGRRATAAKRARIVDGHWLARFAVPWAGGRSGARRILVTARFAGTSRVRAGHSRRVLKLH